MKRRISVWQMAGFIFTAVAGTLLHFLFDWTGGSAVVAVFSAVNESIWEHLKLLFYPMLMFAAAEYFAWGREKESFWCVKLMGILLGFALIVIVYYTYTGTLGIEADWFNIALFFFAAGVTCFTETKLFQRQIPCGKWGILLILALVAIFTVWTFSPPKIPLFLDSSTGSYGFQS